MPITYKDIRKQDNGAHFYTADLHVHSFGGSQDVTDNGMTVEAIIDSCPSHKVSILCITDHNSAKHVERSIDYGAKYAGQLLVLAGAEITTANGHLLAYFSPSRPGSVQDLLSRVEIVGSAEAGDTHTKKSMADVIKEVEALGGIAVAAHIDSPTTGFEELDSGYPNWKKDIITSSGLLGLEFKDASNLGWYSDSEDKSIPRAAERAKLLTARANSPQTASRPTLATFQNSDAHDLRNFKAQAARKSLTRIKMDDLTFEGFRTALIDPGARVRVQASLPRAIPRTLGIHMDGGFLDGETYRFSDNLNCFIGGRGTGKSTAVRAIAYTLGLDEEFEEHGNCPDSSIL